MATARIWNVREAITPIRTLLTFAVGRPMFVHRLPGIVIVLLATIITLTLYAMLESPIYDPEQISNVSGGILIVRQDKMKTQD